jgi:hypothetical protein
VIIIILHLKDGESRKRRLGSVQKGEIILDDESSGCLVWASWGREIVIRRPIPAAMPSMGPSRGFGGKFANNGQADTPNTTRTFRRF